MSLSDESVEDMANSNLHVMRFLELSLEDDVPDHSVLSRFRTRLTKNPREPKTKPAYVVVSDQEERDDETDAKETMQVIEITQPVSVLKRAGLKGAKFIFGYKQHAVANGLVLEAAT